MDQFERIDTKLGGMLAELGEMRTDQALARQELGYIREHLAKLNGRTEKSEARICGLETSRSEVRGGWKVIAAASTIPASVIAAVASWMSQK